MKTHLFWHKNTPRHKRGWLSRRVPGIISGVGDNDNSGVVTYALSGAIYGLTQIWLILLATPILLAVQSLAAKIGDVTKKGLTRLIAIHFSPIIAWLMCLALFSANTLTIGADLKLISEVMGEIIGGPELFWLLVFASVSWYVLVQKKYFALRKYLFFFSILMASYIISTFFLKLDWLNILKQAFTPHWELSPQFAQIALAVLGTTITPYVMLWQTEEEIAERSPRTQAKDEDKILAPGMLFSNITSIFIVIAVTYTLYGQGDISSVIQLAKALEPLAGVYAKYLFSLGLISVGLVALPVLAGSAGFAFGQLFGWKTNLNTTANEAPRFYGVISLSYILGLLIAMLGFGALKMVVVSQVINGLVAPVLILFMLYFILHKGIMKERVASVFDIIFGCLAVIIMLGSAILMVL